MRNLLLSFFLLMNSLLAMTLDEIIDSSLAKSPSLESINARIKANKQDITIANQFSNPELLLTKNSLDSSQAMSQTVLTFKQKFPYPSKRETNQKVAIAEEHILNEKLQSAKIMLVAKIKNEAYSIWELMQLKTIIDEYILLTKKNIELYEAYVSTNSDQHMGIMKATLSLSELKIERSALNAKIYSAYARLSYLAAVDVEELHIDLKMGKYVSLKNLSNSLSKNPSIAINAKELLKAQAKIALADSNRYPDFNLIAGYAYRERFDNYFNLGVGLSLPIYGTEDAKKEEERLKSLVISSQNEDIKISVNSKLKTFYAQMLSSYEIYHIVEDEALPQVQHMFEISNSSISTGGDLFKYIDVLFQKLKLEQKRIYAVSNYNRAQAKISELQGALQ